MKAAIELETLSRYTHYDPDLEAAVLGGILLEKDCLINIMPLLREELFYQPENRLIYQTVIWMWEKGFAIDMLTVTSLIHQKGLDKWEAICGEKPAVYIMKLTTAVVSTANIQTHCLLLRQMYVNRLLYEAKFSEGYSLDDALETKQKIEEAFNIGAVDSWMTIEEVINKKLIKKMNDPAGRSVIETSFAKLNERSPVEPGDYVIIGARPSIGKTALAMQMAADIGLKGNSVGIISLETKGDKLAARMLAGRSQIEFWRIWKNRLSEYQQEKFYKTASKLSELPVFIYDQPTTDHVGIRIAATKLRRKVKGNLVIFIDYIQLIAPEERTKLDRRLQINEISRTIKLICMELENTSVIALAQLTREAAKESPRMHHLKESGALEQDADKIWLLHRDRDNEEKEKMQGKTTFDASLFIEKNKEGWTGEIDMEFHAEQMTFKEKSSEGWKPITSVNYYEKQEDEN
jgi:replicative DNA helicase